MRQRERERVGAGRPRHRDAPGNEGMPPPGPGDGGATTVNAHGGGVIKECDTFYLHGEYFLSTTTDNDFNGFSMYSSKDLAPGVQTHVIKRRASIWVPPGDSSTA